MTTRIHYPNELFLRTIPSTLARFEYRGEYDIKKKAREVSEKLANEMREAGFEVPKVDAPCPYLGLIKETAYTVRVGSGLSYKTLTEKKAERLSGTKVDFEVKKKDTGMFPIYRELIYVKNDFSQVYIRCYPHIDCDSIEDAEKLKNKLPKPKYFLNGTEVNRLAFAPWACNEDFKRWNGDAPSVNALTTTKKDGSVEFLKPIDENGNELEGYVCTKQIRAVKLQNVKLIVNFEDIVPKMFDMSTYTEETLTKIRDAFLARCNAE